ncbi:class I SAM-dependent methyltransferase [Bradyrhizobium sp. UFLA05-153]
MAPSGVLEMAKCSGCGFAWNRAFDEGLIKYDPDYDNDQMQSVAFQSHMSSMADRVVAGMAPKSASLVEIGCGQATFVEMLAQRLSRQICLFGFDPSWRGDDGGGPFNATIYRRLFDAHAASVVPGGAEFIVARHTIEHIAGPLPFLRAIRSAIQNTPVARLFLETPDIDWIVSSLQVQDIFYEHCSIFSKCSISIALQRAGFEVVNIEGVFGDQYLWVEAKPSLQTSSLPTASRYPVETSRFRDRVSSIVHSWRAFLKECDRPTYLWGAASKGVTFALLVEGQNLAGVVDINPKKIGKFLPVTALPILSYNDLPNGSAVVIMNPNYAAEIQRMASARADLSLFVLGDLGAIKSLQ